MTADGELIDLVLTERRPRWLVREAIEAVVPAGWRLVDLSDVWLGGPALAGVVGAADYRITLNVPHDLAAADVATAARAVIAARTLPRQREKGGGSVAYDLRPLLVGIEVVGAGPPAIVQARTRFHPSLGTGRPEEVVAALADELGRPLTIANVVRERLILADELE